jgi:hypothetical protein
VGNGIFTGGCALISEIKENDDEHSMLGCCRCFAYNLVCLIGLII